MSVALRALLALGCWLTAALPPEEDGVLVLSSTDFAATVKSSPFILVEFYAPWCGHCRQFAPDYAAAAQELKRTDPPVPLAKIDATAETAIAEEYGVTGYPTLRLFIDGRDQEYTGGRTAKRIVKWVLKKVGPPAVLVQDVDQAEAILNDNFMTVIGFFTMTSSRQAYESAARLVDDVAFAYTTSPALAQKYGVSAPGLKMFFPHDEKSAVFSGNLQDIDEVKSFVGSYKLPLVVPFSGETSAAVFQDGRPILFLFREPTDGRREELENVIRQTASNLKRRFVVSIAGIHEPMDQRLMDYVAVEPDDVPTIRLVEEPQGVMQKYRLQGPYDAARITTFAQDWEAKKLKPYLRSQAEPEAQDGPVYILVGTTFERVVKDTSKDVLVMFYAPWCGHCKRLEPLYKQVAQKLRSVKSLLIAKIDATANDVEGIHVQGFPMLKFYAGKQKAAAIDYDSDRDLESFVTWLESKVSYPFSGKNLKDEL
eukprot:TRINITY_DN82081_c0_g1_i1.p1 TRINITY_DN82081_c0_g1~~TRINITY_DN82081_c0_g1_i1.p1  ORF type:complete len:482 (+),score=117.90 TRINITY_DN82081_c0_g1_i1:63-1508(+)